jgi:hypothetical protein
VPFREGRRDVESQFTERHGVRSLQTVRSKKPLNLMRMGVRCLGFSGQSNSLFSKDKEGRSDAQREAKGED